MNWPLLFRGRCALLSRLVALVPRLLAFAAVFGFAPSFLLLLTDRFEDSPRAPVLPFFEVCAPPRAEALVLAARDLLPTAVEPPLVVPFFGGFFAADVFDFARVRAPEARPVFAADETADEAADMDAS